MAKEQYQNTVDEARALQQMLLRIGDGVGLVDHIASSSYRGMYEFAGLSLRPPKEVSGEWLCVLKAFDAEGTPVVAFHSAHGGAECLASAIKRFADGQLKFKLDSYRA